MSPEPGPRQLTMTTLMTPDLVNFSGKVHGGALLKLLDEVAYATASRYAGRYVVTLLADQVRFQAPVHVGDLVTFDAHVDHVGRSSIEVGIEATAENPRLRDRRQVIACSFLMVAVGDDGKPATAPPFTPSTDEERDRWAAAETRRAARR